jgi:hypothetical protein
LTSIGSNVFTYYNKLMIDSNIFIRFSFTIEKNLMVIGKKNVQKVFIETDKLTK